MRFLLSITLILVLAALAEYLLPWWSIAIVAFIISIILRLLPGKAFMAGFVAIALLWLACALLWDLPNDHLLSGRMARVFSLPGYIFFIAVTVFVGGIIGGLSAWSGAHIRRLISTKL